MRTAFITGCGSGFGFRLARRLLREGYRVVATDPDTSRWPEALGAPNERLLVQRLDVRDEEAVRRTVAVALDWGPVDVLVNNAGVAVFGTQEEVALDAVRDMFEVNVFGGIRVTQALLPMLRSRSGTIVQLSSVAGRTVFPESGFYAATKYSVEALSEALHQETCRFGVRIRVVEPGAFATQFQARAAVASPPRSASSPYAASYDLWDDRKNDVLESPQNPDHVVDAIVGSLEDQRLFVRVPVGLDAVRILALRDALGPDAWSRCASGRVGAVDEACEVDVFSAPEGVLAVWTGDPARLSAVALRRLQATAAAEHFGHLKHWVQTDKGTRALEILRLVGYHPGAEVSLAPSKSVSAG